MNAQDKTTHVIQQQMLNDILYRLSLFIDDIQFAYAKPPHTVQSESSPPTAPDEDDQDDGTPWDDDLPFV